MFSYMQVDANDVENSKFLNQSCNVSVGLLDVEELKKKLPQVIWWLIRSKTMIQIPGRTSPTK